MGDVVSRAVVMLAARRGGAPSELEAALLRYGDALRSRLPAGAHVRLGVRHPDDPMGAAMGARGELEPVDGLVEVTLPGDWSPADAAATLDGLAGELGDAIDPSRSAAVAGPCHRLRSRDGCLMLALSGRRAPGTTMTELSDWWLNQHGPLVLDTLDPEPLAYEQLHGDPDASRAAAAAAGVASAEYDMFDTGCYDRMEDFTESLVTNPEAAARLYEDELGHVDHGSLRGAIQRVL